MAVSLLGKLLRKVRPDENRSSWYAPELAAEETLQVQSTAFQDGQAIPLTHSGKGRGDNLSPALSWSQAPAGTKQLLLIIEDIDVPLPRPIIHTIAALSPSLLGLPEGSLNQEDENIRFLPASFGSHGYAGPRPLPGTVCTAMASSSSLWTGRWARSRRMWPPCLNWFADMS